MGVHSKHVAGALKGRSKKASRDRFARKRKAIEDAARGVIARGENVSDYIEAWREEHGYKDASNVRRIVAKLKR